MRFGEIGVNGQDDIASFQHSDQRSQKKWLIPKKETHRLASPRILSEEFPGNPIGGGIQLVVGERGLMVLDGRMIAKLKYTRFENGRDALLVNGRGRCEGGM